MTVVLTSLQNLRTLADRVSQKYGGATRPVDEDVLFLCDQIHALIETCEGLSKEILDTYNSE